MLIPARDQIDWLNIRQHQMVPKCHYWWCRDNDNMNNHVRNRKVPVDELPVHDLQAEGIILQSTSGQQLLKFVMSVALYTA
jgi:hypothetical protein